jgi:hypothetical protein
MVRGLKGAGGASLSSRAQFASLPESQSPVTSHRSILFFFLLARTWVVSKVLHNQVSGKLFHRLNHGTVGIYGLMELSKVRCVHL